LKHERELAATKTRAKKSKDRNGYASKKEDASAKEKEDLNGDRHPNNDTMAFPAYSSASSRRSRSTLFVADSGATDHMSDQLHIFNVFTAVTPGDWKIKGIGTDSALQVHGYGTVNIRSKVDGIWYDGILEKVLYVPNLGITLFSIGTAADLGCVVTFDKNQIQLCQNNTPVAVGTRSSQDDLYYLNIEFVPTTASAFFVGLICSSLNLASAFGAYQHNNYQVNGVNKLCYWFTIVKIRRISSTAM
jgi:hypothetical protein